MLSYTTSGVWIIASGWSIITTSSIGATIVTAWRSRGVVTTIVFTVPVNVIVIVPVVLLLGFVHIDGLSTFLLGFDGGGLEGTGGDYAELGIGEEVGKVSTWGEEDVTTGDVGGSELGAVFHTLAGEGDPEVAQFAQTDFLTIENALAEALHRHDSHGHDVCLTVLGVVLGDVLSKLFEFHHTVVLGRSVGFGRFLRFQEVLSLDC